MRGTVIKVCYFLIFLQIFGVTSRFLGPNQKDEHHSIPLSGKGQIPQYKQVNLSPKQYKEAAASKLKGNSKMNQEEIYKGMNKKLGSSPPNCEHKCYGCMPCQPTQVPTETRRIGLQYTNYEPEGWKCKCGSFFYSP